MRSRSPRGRTALAALALVALPLAGCSPATPSPAPSSSPAASASPLAASPSASPTAAPTATPAPTPEPTPAPVAFTLMEFNIEYGGVQIDFDKIIEAIRKADPDVVALEEAEGNTAKVAAALGWPYYSVRSQLVSKLPLVDPPGANGRFEYAELAPGRVVAISNVHLPSDPYGPYDVRDGKPLADVIKLEEDTRLPAAQERLDVLPALVQHGIPTFLTGDFNTPSHLDWTAAMVGLRPQIKYAVPWPVTVAAERAGFQDAYRVLYPDPVKDPGLTWWADRPLVDGYPDHNDPQDRIDLILFSGAATPTAFRIAGEKGGPQVDIEVSPWGTDHRAVIGTFEVTPGAPDPFVAVAQRLIGGHDPVAIRYHATGADGEHLAIVPLGATGAPGTAVDARSVAGAADGTWSFETSSLAAGDYAVQLVTADGSVTATAPFTFVADGAWPVVSVDAASYKAGAPITVSWRAGPGSRWDWIGVYKHGEDTMSQDYLLYTYTAQQVNGSVVLDKTGYGTWPLPPGKYDVHYLLDDGYKSLGFATFTVTK